MLQLSDVEELRRDFPLFEKHPDIAYLDNAATTQKPGRVIERERKFYQEENANIHRGLYSLSQDATLAYEEAHDKLTRFMNAGKDEIIFTKGTTESINLLACSLPQLAMIADGSRNEIVLSEMEHHSNLVPWQQAAQRHGLKIKFLPVSSDFTLSHKDFRDMITEKTAIVSIAHVSNALGTKNDVKKICDTARKKGAVSIIDGAQGMIHDTADVRDIGCDFYTFSGHKMLGPTGTGGLFGRQKLLEEMPPYQFGGDMIRKVSYKDAEWNDLPMKFEAGTQNIAGSIALGSACDYLGDIGMRNILQWENDLLSYAMDSLEDIKGISIFTPGRKKSAGIISFNLAGVHAHDVASILDMHHVCIRGGHHCAMPLMAKLGLSGTARASFALYNTQHEIDEMIKGIKDAKNTFGA